MEEVIYEGILAPVVFADDLHKRVVGDFYKLIFMILY